MLPSPSDRVWVLVELVKGGQLGVYRGAMRRADLDSLLAGTFGGAFVRLDHVHWLDKGRVVMLGREGEWEASVGALHLRVDQIHVLGELKGPPDVSGLAEDSDAIQQTPRRRPRFG
jgi:hypothetical protein